MSNPFEGLTALVQFRSKRNGVAWRNMAAFDLRGIADWYCAQQESKIWEYRAIDVDPELQSDGDAEKRR